MTMSRKDFELIASVLHRERINSGDSADWIIDRLALRFADILAGTNGRFDRDRFIRACS